MCPTSAPEKFSWTLEQNLIPFHRIFNLGTLNLVLSIILTGTNVTTDYTNVPIVECSFQLAYQSQRLIALFPKNLRSQIGDRLGATTMDFFEHMSKVNFLPDSQSRCDALKNLSGDLFVIKMLVRMAKDLKLISVGQFTEYNARISDLQRQITAWGKWTKTKMLDREPTRPLS